MTTLKRKQNTDGIQKVVYNHYSVKMMKWHMEFKRLSQGQFDFIDNIPKIFVMTVDEIHKFTLIHKKLLPKIKIIPSKHVYVFLDTIINFGKYKYSTVQNVIMKDPQYIRWAIDKGVLKGVISNEVSHLLKKQLK